jgi:hypothetical protein
MSDKVNDKRSQYIGTHVFHILVVAPLLYYVGMKKETAPEGSINLLKGIFALAIAYHGMNLLGGINYISVGHVLMGSVGLYILMQKEKPELFYFILLFLSLYVVVRHGYLLSKLF